MNFTSLPFLIFLPIVVISNFIIPPKYRHLFLLGASYFFYAYYNLWLLSLILITTIISFWAGKIINKYENKKIRKFWFILTLIVCLGLLIVFKYLDFISESALTFLSLFGINVQFNGFNLILPMGISFFTFQTLSYVIDVYKKTIRPTKEFSYYALFVVFFPQLVAGPIERPENLIPQLKETHRFNHNDFCEGIHYILLGFVKKVVIADYIAIFVNNAFNQDVANGFVYLIGTGLFAIQIYCDFAGYSEIALGCARMMGIKLMKNFDHPYGAKSIREFWKRWHISLTTWFTDYVYIPLGGNRKGKFRQCINTLIVFLISGLWHGARWTFVIWGLLHGIYLVLEILMQPMLTKMEEKTKLNNNSIYNAMKTMFIFILVCFSWIFFRSNSLNQAFTIIKTIFTSYQGGFDTALSATNLTYLDIFQIVLSIFSLYCLRYLPKYQVETSEDKSINFQSKTAVIYFMIILLIAFSWLNRLAMNGSSEFIYFEF